MQKFKLGLVIAQDEKDLSELKRFITDSWADVLLFPEYYLDSNKIDEVCDLCKKNNKWLITGMEDRRFKDKFYQSAIVISNKGKLIGSHLKTSITKFEIDSGQDIGDSIEIIETEFGKIGIAICYELHLPEISRILALKGAEIIFNPIGTGMWNEDQYTIWTNLASIRAYENGVFVVGCSHYNDGIPIAFAYDLKGKCILKERSVNRLIPITIDPANFTFGRNFGQRRPGLYKELITELSP